MTSIAAHRRAGLRDYFAPQIAAAAKPDPLDVAEIRHFPVCELAPVFHEDGSVAEW